MGGPAGSCLQRFEINSTSNLASLTVFFNPYLLVTNDVAVFNDAMRECYEEKVKVEDLDSNPEARVSLSSCSS